MRPWSITTGSPSPRSSQRNRVGVEATMVASSTWRCQSRHGPHGDALPITTEKPVGGPRLDREMKGQLADGPRPVDVGARAAGQQGASQVGRVEPLEPRDRAAEVPDIVG